MADFLQMGRRVGAFLMSEANNFRSRGTGTVVGAVKSGTILGLIVTAGATAAAVGGNVGNGVLTLDATDPVLSGAKAGVYKVVITDVIANGGNFEVIDPEGKSLGSGRVGTLFSNKLKFTLADGATDFARGDNFTITVVEGVKQYKPVDLTATDGSEIAVAILLLDTEATTNAALIKRSAEVTADDLIYPTGATTAQKTAINAALEKVGIIVRED